MLKKKSLGLWLSLAAGCLFVSASAFAYGGEAVIVYNPASGAFGSYHGTPDYASAYNNAEALCGAGCSTVTYANNGWVALARSSQNSAIEGTAGVHDSEGDAENAALANCESKAAQSGLAGSCYVLRSLASFDYAPDLNGVGN